MYAKINLIVDKNVAREPFRDFIAKNNMKVRCPILFKMKSCKI